jgi:hypothetical protein
MTTRTDQTSVDDVGLPDFPKLIFLDTNVVQNLQTFGEFIYDNNLTPALEAKMTASGCRFTDDIFALANFIALGHRAGWPFAVSSRTLEELEDTPQLDKRAVLANWGTQLADFFDSHLDESPQAVEGSSYSEINHFTYLQRCALSNLLQKLPQESDRQLIVDALEFGCDIFLTMDYRTVWRHREEVRRFGLRVMRPVELLEYIRPWAGLLR